MGNYRSHGSLYSERQIYSVAVQAGFKHSGISRLHVWSEEVRKREVFLRGEDK